MRTSPAHPDGNRRAMIEALIKGSRIYDNLGQDIVVTTTDKLTLELLRHQKWLSAQKDWVAPAGLFISLVAALVSSSFKATLGLSPDAWQALFVLGLFFSFGWLILSVIRAIEGRKKGDIERGEWKDGRMEGMEG